MDEFEQYQYHQAKAWLDHIAKIKHAVEASRDMVEMFAGLASGARALDYTQERVSGSPHVQRLEDAIVKLEEARAQWQANMAEYADEATDAAKRINQLADDVEKRALLLHYVDGFTWERICVQMDYSWMGLMKIRRRGVLHMYEHMPLSWRDPIHTAL